MKFNTFLRHVREGFKNIIRNGWMTVASVGAVTMTLILVGAFLAVILNLNNMIESIENEVEIKVLIDRTAGEEDIHALGEDLRRIDGIETISFASKDDELNSLVESMGDHGNVWLMFKDDNPLRHAYIVKAEDPTETESIAQEIDSMDYVEELVYGQDVISRLFQFNKYARTIGLILVIGLVMTAIFLISNTIKLTIMARQSEITIMKLVGATNGFIRGPFFIEGILLGILGSIIPVAMILIGYHFIEQAVVSGGVQLVEILPYDPFAWQLSLFILAIGIIIGIWGSVMSIRKFLKV